MWIERRMQDDASFPKPIFLGRLRHWRLSELERWEAAQKRKESAA
jgi:predicted DNA-binding transcriptional regulator AlpA